MTCSLCPNNGEPVEVQNDSGDKINIPICDACLADSFEDSFLFTNFVQSQFDIKREQ
jgi:hypothetical protein